MLYLIIVGSMGHNTVRKDTWREVKEQVKEEELLYKNFTEENYTELFDNNKAILFDLISNCDALQLLAGMALYGFSGVMDSSGHILINHESGVSQSQLELIQGIALSHQRGKGTPNAEVVIKTLDASTKAEIAYKRKKSSGYIKNVEMLLHIIKSHTQHRRDLGDIKERVEIAKKLIEPLNGLFEKILGISGKNIIEINSSIFNTIQINSTKRYSGMLEILQQKNSRDMLKKYFEINNYYDNVSEQYADKPIDYIKNSLLTHSQSLIVNDYVFDINSLSEQLNIDVGKIKKALAFICLDFGEIDPEKTSVFIDNPVWLRPLIKINENKFFCCIPQLLIGNVLRILQSITEKNNQLKEEYHNKKSKFLENEVESLFKVAFPSCEITKRYEGDQSENDLLVKVGLFLLIVECKSGTVTMPALRGAHDRVKKHIEDLIYEPSRQSIELERKIKKIKETPSDIDNILPKFPFKIGEIDAIIRISIILEDFASMQTATFLIEDAGWIPNGHNLSPCFALSDLKRIFDILDKEYLKIHYLKRRSEINNAKCIGEEMDYLGSYLMCGFRVNQEDDMVNFMAGNSQVIDDYYDCHNAGISINKPSVKIHKFWLKLCDFSREICGSKWPHITNLLLDIRYPDQENISKMLSDSINDKDKFENRSLVCISPLYDDKHIVFYIYHGSLNAGSSSQELARNIGHYYLDNDKKLESVLIIAIDSDDESVLTPKSMEIISR